MTEQSTIQANEKSQTVSRQGTMQESVTSNKTEQLSSNKVGFMDKGTGEHQSNQVFSKNGTSPTIPAISYKEPLKIVDKYD